MPELHENYYICLSYRVSCKNELVLENSKEQVSMNFISCCKRFLWLSYDILMPSLTSWQTVSTKMIFFFTSLHWQFSNTLLCSLVCLLKLTFLSAYLMFASMRHHFFWVNISKANLSSLFLPGALFPIIVIKFYIHCYKVL